jgi:DNA-binding FrmR family transcriptional regulator
MLDEGRDCTDLLNQLAAASTALTRAGFVIISTGIQHCNTNNGSIEERAALEKAFMSLA